MRKSMIAMSMLALAVAGGVAVQGQDKAAEKTITITESQLKAMIASEVKSQITQYVESERQAEVDRAAESAHATRDILRSQIELYKLQHGDKAPSLADLQHNWDALTLKTNTDGEISSAGKFGPYVRTPPVNIFMNSSQVSAVGAGTVRTGWTYDARTGQIFLLMPDTVNWPKKYAKDVEVLDTRAVKQQQTAQAAASQLQTIRSMLELYKIQHDDKYPTLVELNGWKVLASRTDQHGVVSDHGKYGPYLENLPVNPVNGKTAVVAQGAASADAGWTFDEKNGAVLMAVPSTFKMTESVAENCETYASEIASQGK